MIGVHVPSGRWAKPGHRPDCVVVGSAMSIEFILRLVGMIAMATGGIYLGIYLADLAGAPAELWASAFAAVGALMGLIVAPFLTTRPVRAFRSIISQVSAQTMLAALLGLIVG